MLFYRLITISLMTLLTCLQVYCQDSIGIEQFLCSSNLIRFKQSVSISSDIELGARGISNATMIRYNNKLYFSDETKKKMIAQLFTKNNLGYDFTNRFRYTFRRSKTKYFWTEVGNRAHLDATITKSALELLLNGNSYSAGNNIDISGNRFNSVSWQYLSVGSTFVAKKFILSGGVGFVSGKRNTSANIESGNIYTDQDGEYINLRIRADAYQAKPLSAGAWKMGGAGFTSSLQLIIPKKSYTLQIGFNDLGVVRWVNNAKVTHVDTSIHFEGLVINDFNMIRSDSARQRLADSITGIPNGFINNRSYSGFLPAQFYATYIHQWGTDLVSVSLDYIYGAYPLPRLAFNYYRIKKMHSFNPQIALGGYNYYDINFGYTLALKTLKINCLLKSIRGLIAPKVSSGAGLFLSISKNI